MADIIIFGAGQIADVARVYIESHGPHRVMGFVVDGAFQRAHDLAGRPIVAWETLEAHFPPDKVELLGPLSYRQLNELRRDRYLEGKARGYRFASFVHPASHIYTTDIGENSFILEANVIQPFVRIGHSALIWSGNHIGHHSTIGDACFLASSITVGSNVAIGDECLIAGCSGINPNVSVGAQSYIGTYAQVSRDVPAAGVILNGTGRLARFTSARIKHRL
jgi:acetyltransferase-like isoleucine patch superfamily enzyme